MDIEMEVLDNKGKIKLAERKIQAVINVLQREGLIRGTDVEEELNSLMDEGEQDAE